MQITVGNIAETTGNIAQNEYRAKCKEHKQEKADCKNKLRTDTFEATTGFGLLCHRNSCKNSESEDLQKHARPARFC